MYNLVDIHFHTDDSFDAFEKESFDIDKLISILKDENDDYSIKLLCKTDHNRFNFKKYLEMAKKLYAEGITLLPGIEINSTNSIHWIIIFDNISVNVGIPENDDYYGQTLDDKINEFFRYDLSEKNETLLNQAQKIQATTHDIKSFIKILHDLNIPYIAIPHLNKTKGWYIQLKKDKEQLKVVEEFLNSNIINGFESKNQDDFIGSAIKQTQDHIDQIQNDYKKLESSKTEEEKKQFKEGLQRRIDHLKSMIRLNNSITNGDAALIYGSDFHCRGNETIESYKEYKNDLFFIKAEPTFEGLRISLLDQFSRIFTHERKRKFSKNSITCIDHIVLDQAGKEVIIPFGDGLNSIIGARGTGKSYLLSLITGKTEKYKDSTIVSDISLKRIVFSNGTEKDTLTPIDYDFLTQRGTNTSMSDQNENSIYGLLADAPFKMASYLEEIRKLDQSPTSNLCIGAFIDRINKLVDCYIEIANARNTDLNISFFNLYNEYYTEQSDNIRLSELFGDSEHYMQTEVTQIKEALKQIEIVQNNTDLVLDALQKIENQKYFSSTGITFIDEKKSFVELKEGKLSRLSTFYKQKKEVANRVLKIIETITYSIRQNSTNTENTLSNNINNLSSFIITSISSLRKSKKESISVCNEGQTSVKDEEVYKINVGQQVYEIKTISTLNIFNLSQKEFEELFSFYKVEYIPDIFVDCFKFENFGKEFIEKVYNKLDRRHKNYHFEIPQLEKELFLNFDGSFKNWKTLSPGQRADKLLDIVLDGDSGKILLIDQPEDDLDNETIYKTITKKIRELKLRRQIVIVTHNANIAITGDSDKIIVCQNDNKHFSCYCDGIESQKLYSYKSINSTLNGLKMLLIAAEILDGENRV